MKNRIMPISAAALVVAGLGVAGFAMADSGTTEDDAAEHRAFLSSSVSVAAAAEAAEAETGARAMSVEFEEEDGVYLYEVELLTQDGKELEALVDANTATVGTVREDDGNDEGDDDSDSDSDGNGGDSDRNED